MRRSLLLALALCLFVIPAAAQNDPAPLTAEDIFAPNVEIRYVTPDEPLRDYAADDQLRVMSLGGRVIPYPEGFEKVTIAQIDDETFLIENRVTINADELQYESKRWLYKKSTDVLIEPRSQCQDRGFDRYLPEIVRQPWIIILEDGSDVLCNVLTGVRTPSLPSERVYFGFHYENSYTTDDGILDVSPDGRYVVISGWETDTSRYAGVTGNSLLFRYDLQTDTFLTLGTYANNGAVYDEIDRWFGSEFAMIIADSCGQCAKSLYMADVTRENSLIHAMYSSLSPHFIDNPPRYVADDEGFMDEYYCFAFVFDLTTRIETMYSSPVGCRPEYGMFEGVGYYRREEDSEAIVARYAAQTQEQQDLYRGEVEHVQWVSEDVRYAIMLLDDNGRLDDSPHVASFMDTSDYGFTRWALIDLASGETLVSVPNYELANGRWRHPDRNLRHLGIFPLSDNSFVTNTCTGGANSCESEISELVTVSDEGVVVTPLDVNPVRLIPDRTTILVPKKTGEPFAGYDLYDLLTGEVTPFIVPLQTDIYDSLNIYTDADGKLSVYLTAQEQWELTAIFSVEIAPDGSPIVLLDSTAIVQDAVAATPVVVISATPSMTYTPTLTPTLNLTYEPSCNLSIIADVNLRNMPDADPESGSIIVGSAAVGTRLIASAYFENTDDGFVWWKLTTGEWLREDFVEEFGYACDLLSVVATSQPSYLFITRTPTFTPSPTVTRTPTFTPTPVPACEMTVIMGANLRSEPDAGSHQVGSAAEGFELTAVGQFASTEDFFTWWKLDTGEWLREDFAREQATCTLLALVDASAPDFVFVTPTPSSTPTVTATVTARATATPELSASCTLTVVTGANLRAGPAVETEKVGSAAVDFVLMAVGQAENTQDFFTWWQLDTGEWIREDFVREGEGCDVLPTVQP